MPVIEPRDQSLKNLQGIHLWHDDLSSCSQRVRATLAIKGQSWESHLLAIPKGDNTTPEYLAINPNGLVPALVHDGVLMTESTDIIDYLDRTFPEPSLRPQVGRSGSRRCGHWMDEAGKAQPDLKVLSHEFLFRAVRKITADDMENFEKNVDNEALVAFMRVYHADERLPPSMVTDSVDRTDRWFSELDDALADNDWLVGDALSLADISWMPNVHRMELMDWPFERYPNLVAWHDRVEITQCIPGRHRRVGAAAGTRPLNGIRQVTGKRRLPRPKLRSPGSVKIQQLRSEGLDPRPQLDLPGPGAAWLLEHVHVRGCNRIGVEESVRPCRVGRPASAADSAVDDEMADMDPLWRQFAGHALSQTAQRKLSHRERR